MRPRVAALASLLLAAAALAGHTLRADPASAATRPAPAATHPRLTVSAAALAEPTTGRRLYAVNADARLPIASTTKLMTALITLEHVRHLSTVFTQNDYYPAVIDSQIGLVPGERMSVHDLLLALLLPSADDAAEDLAYNVGDGSLGRFIAMMNARARELGLLHTHYSTPSGLDTPGNYSSASDLVKLAGYLLAHEPFFARAVAQRAAVLRTGHHMRYVANRNNLVGRIRWITGVKTGHTSSAGYVLVGSGRRGGMTLISAVLGTTSESARDANTLTLLEYGFRNFRLVEPIRRGQVIARLPVRDQPGERVAVFAAQSVRDVVPRRAVLSSAVVLPRQLAGPLNRDAEVGQVVVRANGRPLARVSLRLAQRVPAVSTSTRAARFLTRPSTLLALVALLLAAVASAAVWRWRARGKAAAGPEAA
ncbi:MAG: D-alanyl-D-alanine carboxypeptidase [Solirubrobacterales bacterium]|nr:D-alanyl-D-alanine carboxypeptidase [Solirubrobacterales bacterium]